MEAIEPTNLEVLRYPESMGFIEELDFSPDTLKSNQSVEFFEILLSYFANEISLDLGNHILATISKVICVKEHLSVFVQQNFINKLPFNQKAFIDPIFDILYILVTLAPVSFNEEFSKQFGLLIRRGPQKSLTILALFSQHFDDIDNPWPIVDLLIQESSRFSSFDNIVNYVTLLAFLCRKFPDFCAERGKHCWHKISSIIVSAKDLHIIGAAYFSLYSITEVYQDGVAPIDAIKIHIKIKELQDSALTLLLAAPPKGKDSKDKQLLLLLISIAEKNRNATLVLIRMALDFEFSEFLVVHSALWMTKELPTALETFRLFFSVFYHRDLRPLIKDSPNFVSLLKMVVEQENSSTLSMICTIIRRIDITEEFIKQLSDSGFLNIFFSVSTKIGSNVSLHSTFLLIDTLAKVSYSREFLKMCDYVVDTIKERGELSEIAGMVAIQLCNYKKCLQAFQNKHLNEFFQKSTLTPKLKKISAKYFEFLQKTE